MASAPSAETLETRSPTLDSSEDAPYGCMCSVRRDAESVCDIALHSVSNAQESWFWREYDHARIWASRSSHKHAAVSLLLFRGFSTLWWGAILAYTFGRKFTTERDETPWRHMVYWTNQSLFFLILYFGCSTACGFIALRRAAAGTSQGEHEASLRSTSQRWRAHAWWALLRLTRLLYEICVTWETTIVVMFWAVLAAPSTYDNEHWFLNMVQHMLGIVFLLVDTCAGCMRPQDRVYAGAFCSVLVYLLLNYIVSVTTFPVYSALTWRGSISGGLVIAAALLLTLVHYLYVLLTWARDRCVQARWSPAQQRAVLALLRMERMDDAISKSDVDVVAVVDTAVWHTWYPSVFSDELAAYPCSQCVGPASPWCSEWHASCMTCIPGVHARHRLTDVRSASTSADAPLQQAVCEVPAEPAAAQENRDGEKGADKVQTIENGEQI